MIFAEPKPLTAPLIPLYRSAILEWLKGTGPKTSAEIENYLRNQFQSRWKARDRKINRRGIPQWRNDVHWALAYLSQHGLVVKGAGQYAAVADSAIKPRRKAPKPIPVKEAKPDSKKLFDSLTADILDALRQGHPPWRKLWGDLRRPKKQIDFAPLAIPTNAETGKPYFGVNTLILWNVTRKRLLPESRWGTAQTWWRLGAEVKLQADPCRVLAWVKVKEKDPDDDDETWLPVWHRVFNLADVNGCDHLRQNQRPVRIIRTEGEIDTSRAWRFIQKCGAKVRWGGDRACYNPAKDLIKMPNKQRFSSELDVLTVLFHELGHWTGHQGRLNRIGVKAWPRESPEYAFEELVAELTTCFVLAYLGIPDRYGVGQHAGYIQGYIRLLENC
jgi:antirestriction protein ArdC